MKTFIIKVIVASIIVLGVVTSCTIGGTIIAMDALNTYANNLDRR